MRLTLATFVLPLLAVVSACHAPRGPEVATAALSAAEEPSLFDATRASNACAESLSAFTAADVRARRDAHAVVAVVEPGLVARAERNGLLCEATLDVTWREVAPEGDASSERAERVRVVAHRATSGELAVLLHEEAPGIESPTAAAPPVEATIDAD